MKKYGTLILVLILSLSTSAQVIISLEDYISKGQIGDTSSYREAFNVHVDLGSFGQTSWDFSNVTMDETIFVEVLDPAPTPFFSRFPNATHSIHQVISGNFPSEVYGYTSTSDTSVNYYGESITDNSGDFHIMFSPARELIFPLIFNSEWTYEGTETFVLGGSPDSNPLTVINQVSSYGELTLPSGRVEDALLLRAYEIRDFDGFTDTSKTFTFLTANADVIILFLASTHPDTGETDVGDVIWHENIVTAVENNETLVKEYQLKQNYPNPFNPSTIIEYSLPEAGKVDLKIYDSLGKEVAVLVNEFKQAGNYRIEFKPDGLASGIYFARFHGGDYSQSIKLTLLK